VCGTRQASAEANARRVTSPSLIQYSQTRRSSWWAGLGFLIFEMLGPSKPHSIDSPMIARRAGRAKGKVRRTVVLTLERIL